MKVSLHSTVPAHVSSMALTVMECSHIVLQASFVTSQAYSGLRSSRDGEVLVASMIWPVFSG